MTGKIFDIKKFAIHDGPGIRTTIFLKGCPLKCWWCHNPESIKNISNDELNTCSSKDDIVTRSLTVDETMRELKKDLLFYDESGGGITFSGGEPLIQIDFLEQILISLKKEYIHTTIDTCGFVNPNSFERIYKHTNLFLYDLKLFDNELHEKYTGVSTQLIKQNLEYLNSVKAKIIVRIPLIPSITDTEENLNSIANYLLQMKSVERIDLLPYNKLSEDKYKRLNQESKLGTLITQTPERLNEIKNIVKSFGLNAYING